METNFRSRDGVPRSDDPRALLPYPLSPGEIGFWLRRGEQLAGAAGWLAATIAAGYARAASWRHVARKGPTNSPPQPG